MMPLRWSKLMSRVFNLRNTELDSHHLILDVYIWVWYLDSIESMVLSRCELLCLFFLYLWIRFLLSACFLSSSDAFKMEWNQSKILILQNADNNFIQTWELLWYEKCIIWHQSKSKIRICKCYIYVWLSFPSVKYSQRASSLQKHAEDS